MSESIIGSRYVPPAHGQPILNLSQGSVSFAGGGLQQSFSSDVSMNEKNRVTDLTGNHLKISFSPSRGTFAGQVRDPTTSQPISFNGVVLQKQNSGGGFFTATNQTGEVLIQPAQ